MSLIKATTTFTPRDDLGRFVEVQITPAVRASVKAATDFVVQEAKALCPVDTGVLRDSIGATVEDGEQTVIGRIEASAPYAGFVEYGTGMRGASSPGAGPYPYSPSWPGQVAQPFLRPALDSAREVIREIFGSQLGVRVRE